MTILRSWLLLRSWCRTLNVPVVNYTSSIGGKSFETPAAHIWFNASANFSMTIVGLFAREAFLTFYTVFRLCFFGRRWFHTILSLNYTLLSLSYTILSLNYTILSLSYTILSLSYTILSPLHRSVYRVCANILLGTWCLPSLMATQIKEPVWCVRAIRASIHRNVVYNC
jgi:hypothetical protein